MPEPSNQTVVTSGTDVLDISQKHPAQLMGPIFSQAVLAVLFALTFEKALEVKFDSLRVYSSVVAWWASIHTNMSLHAAGGLQLLAFLATLFRFYAGSYRFHKEPPASTTNAGVVIDLAGTAILFVGFYIAALLVNTGGLFLLFVMVFHAIDVIWFIVSGAFTSHRPHVQKVINHYLAYDLATIILAAAVWAWAHATGFTAANFQVASSVILLLMFGIDVLWHSRDWYFQPEKWERNHGGAKR